MSRPFCKDRDGFVLGEGAWMFVLEDRDHALARNAPVLAELLGHGSTCDAFHRVQPAPDATESVRAIQMALADAALSTDQIDYVNLHGTSTQMNDALETLAMHKAFGDRASAIPMSTTKSMIGHPQGACGAAGLAASILSIRAGFLHPTINMTDPDPACDLDYIPNTPRPIDNSRPLNILCNCIAFGSKNSALVVRV
jgi:3-oxoacyl-[acyl-carrier-protein] synthase II